MTLSQSNHVDFGALTSSSQVPLFASPEGYGSSVLAEDHMKLQHLGPGVQQSGQNPDLDSKGYVGRAGSGEPPQQEEDASGSEDEGSVLDTKDSDNIL
jgi:hypothetical protein